MRNPEMSHAGHFTLPLFFYFFCIPANEWGMKNRSVAILLGSGFRHSSE